MPFCRVSLLSLSLLAFSDAFSTQHRHDGMMVISIPYQRTATMNRSRQRLASFMQSDDNDVNDNSESQKQISGRRGFIGNLASSVAVVGVGMMAISASPSPAVARDELYKPNPLTNSVLEQVS